MSASVRPRQIWSHDVLQPALTVLSETKPSPLVYSLARLALLARAMIVCAMWPVLASSAIDVVSLADHPSLADQPPRVRASVCDAGQGVNEQACEDCKPGISRSGSVANNDCRLLQRKRR